MADGCVHRAKPGSRAALLVLGLSECDRSHIEKLRTFLSSDHPIRTRKAGQGYETSKSACYLTISSRQITDDLGHYGVAPRKSKTAEVKHLETNRHFWRGVIDGDGSLSATRNGGKEYPTLQLCGAQPLMRQFVAYVHGLVPNWKGGVRVHKQIFAVGLVSSAALAMIRDLYRPGDVALERKAERARQHLARTWNIRSRIGVAI
jgi:hypothetical protein